jgi:hypothetical protein
MSGRHGAHLDNASIVDHNINAPKALGGLIHCGRDFANRRLLYGDAAPLLQAVMHHR